MSATRLCIATGGWQKGGCSCSGAGRRTQHENIGFAADDRAGIGIVLDLGERQIWLASDAQTQTLGKLELGDPYLTPVYNFEVDEFHTYYVGDAAVWVHNANCAGKVPNKGIALERSVESQLAREKLPCFVAGTLVHTKDGKKPIEEIHVGDWVLSYPDNQVPPSHVHEEHEYTYRQVTRTFVHEDKPVCEVAIMNFASNFKETLKVTLDHPFYVSNRGWTPAGELNFMCPLEAKNFGNLATGMPSVTGEQARVYNLEVDEFHTYYVGCLGAWVHNTCELTRLQQA